MPKLMVGRRARLEQDYWFSFAADEWPLPLTEHDRLEFFRYDSHGGKLLPRLMGEGSSLVVTTNPILLGKIRHGQCGEVLRQGYFARDGSWPGGLYVVMDYLERGPWTVRPLVEWFGAEVVEGWLQAWVEHELEPKDSA